MSSKPSSASSVKYVLGGIVLVTFLLAVGIVAIALFGDSESQKGTITLLCAAITPVLMALVGYLVSNQVDAMHVDVNQQAADYAALAQRTALAEGKIAGQAGAQTGGAG